MKTRRTDRGFTLIELMIVVVIIGILAAMAIPRFMAANVRSKQSEAKQVLKQIYIMQRAYRQEYNGYWGDGLTAHSALPDGFERINVEIMFPARYTFTMTATGNTFLCTATCGILDDDATADVWSIDHNNNLIVVSDDSNS